VRYVAPPRRHRAPAATHTRALRFAKPRCASAHTCTHVRCSRAAGDGAGLAVPTHAQAVAGRGGRRAAEQGGRD
jgi:hypothetical protein